MMKLSKMALIVIGAGALSACAATGAGPIAGPIEVTRFHQPATLSQLGQTTIFVESAPGQDAGALELAPYKAAVARELVKIGYRETARDQAVHIAQIRLERITSQPTPKRGPITVGMGGGTGGYRSRVGLGIGINLGGTKSSQQIITQLAVNIREISTNEALWEGRADFSIGIDSPLAPNEENAAIMADALFREFPGNNGESVNVKVGK